MTAKPYFTFKNIFSAAKQQYKKPLFLSNIIAILAALIAVPIPLILPLMVDEVLLDQPGVALSLMDKFLPISWQTAVGYIIAALFASLLLRLFAVALNVWQMRIFTIIAKSITLDMRQKLAQHLKHIAISEYELIGSGGFAAHFVTDIEVIDQFISATISKFIVALLSIIGTAVVLLWINWQLALVILFFNPLVIFFTIRMGKKVKNLKLKENNAIAVFQQALVETLDAIHQIRAANREEYYLKGLLSRARQVRKHSIAYSWKTDTAGRLSNVIFLFGFDIFRALSMIMVLTSGLSIGLMFAVFGYLWFMMAPVQEVLNIQYAYFSAKAALNRVNQIFELTQEKTIPAKINPFKNKTTVSLKLQNITFKYPHRIDETENKIPLEKEEYSIIEAERDQYILSNLSMEISSGEKLALVGASGGGKSSLIQIILGLYPLESGEIYFDNVPASDIGYATIRENISAVLQHPVLFNDTVRSNLLLGQSHDDAQLWNALKIAQLDKTIHALPQQMDTMIGRQGIRLSGGQRQRLAIARMVLAEPKLIILDEATSALDTETEAHLHQSLSEYLQDKTTLIIAHRLSAVKQADRIVVIDHGEIIADGTHHELVNSNELYFRLYGMQ